MTESILMNSLYRRDWIFDSPIRTVGSAFENYLRDKRYGEGTIRFYLAALAHFAYWMQRRRLELSQVDQGLCEYFIANHVPSCRCPAPRQLQIQNLRAALVHLRFVLAEKGLRPDSIKNPMSNELDQYHRYLLSTVGLAPNTCISRLQIIRPFLARFFPIGIVDLATLSVAELDEFVLEFARRWKPASLRVVRSSLKSYMRYRSLKGDLLDLSALTLPVIANWKHATIPKSLTDEQLHDFLAAFDLSDEVGQRDYAIARCLIDLGLRGHEVAQLTLDSFDWSAGTLVVQGSKGRRVKQLPLPWQTGAAIVQYIKRSRPKADSRILFVRHCAPMGWPLGVEGVRGSMKRAFARCGLSNDFCNTHVFRHTIAVRLQCSGASVKQIADVLRHDSLESTAIYARVDLKSLRSVAQPWPGRKS
jgi:integrase/recombinase XerD